MSEHIKGSFDRGPAIPEQGSRLNIQHLTRELKGVEVTFNEINNLKNRVNELQLSSPFIDTLIGFFLGVLTSGAFALIALTPTSPLWVIVASWTITFVGLVGSILCGIFRLLQGNGERKEKKLITDELDRWMEAAVDGSDWESTWTPSATAMKWLEKQTKPQP